MKDLLLDVGAFALKVADKGRVLYLLRGARSARYDHLTVPWWQQRMWVHLTRRLRGGSAERRHVGVVRRTKIENLLLEFGAELREHFLANLRPVRLEELHHRGYEVVMPADSLPAFVEGIMETGTISVEQFMEIGADHVVRRPVADAKALEGGTQGVMLGLVPPPDQEEERVVALYHFPGGVGEHGPGWFTYELGDFLHSALTALLRKHAGVRFLDWLLFVSSQLGIDVDREGIVAMRTEWGR